MAVSLPMEANPDIMNKYLQKLGVSEKWHLVDVIGLDDVALSWVPRPVLALILLFPISDVYEQYRNEQEKTLEGMEPPRDVFHLKQVLSNACGTIALVHCVANNIHAIDINDGLLLNYIKEAKDLDAAAKGMLLEKSTDILEAYRDIARAEDEINADSEEPVNNHFVTFIHKDGVLFELDGRKACPINHGPTTPDRLLEDAAEVCRQFIAREPDNVIGFNVVALVPSQ